MSEKHPTGVLDIQTAEHLERSSARFDHTKIHAQRDVAEWTSPPARPLTGAPKLFENGMSWEMDESGNHRVVDADGVGGDWATYNSVAVSSSGHHIAVTQYFAGDVPAEVVLEIRVLASTGQLPTSAATSGPSIAHYNDIVMEVSGGPGTQPAVIKSIDEAGAIDFTVRAARERIDAGAGVGYRVLTCSTEAQHLRLMAAVQERLSVYLRTPGLCGG